MAKQSAYQKGLDIGTRGAEQPTGRQFETDKAQTSYLEGIVAGLKIRHPGQTIVQCTSDSLIFAAYPQTRGSDQVITCPRCYRGYHFSENPPEDIRGAKGEGWYSDRKLKILSQLPEAPTLAKRHEAGQADSEASS